MAVASRAVFLALLAAGPPAGWADERAAESDAFLDKVQRAAVAYFWHEANPRNGLVWNTTEPHTSASITATGVALSAIVIGVERGWIPREEGYARALQTVKTMAERLVHVHGFFYHYLDFDSGVRVRDAEVSCIDTAIAIASVLAAGEYFKDTEVHQLAQQLYERLEWDWFLNGEETLRWSWMPEEGFQEGSINFSEGLLAYLLALGSPTHPIPAESWHALHRPISRYGNHTVVYAHDGSLFAYLIPLAWLDLRGQHDAFLDYWTNARKAVLANRQFCQDHQEEFATYREGFWGLSATIGPGGYLPYGAKPGVVVHDGTVVPSVVAASIPLVPELALPTFQRMAEQFNEQLWGPYGPTVAFNLDQDFFCPYYVALEHALMLVMIENFRSGLLWRLTAQHPAIQQGLARAGFMPGAQEDPLPPAIRQGNPGATLGIPRVTHPVTIDGELSEWAAQEPIELTHAQRRNLEFGRVQSDADAHLKASVGWDETALYVAGTVQDEELMSRHRGEAIHRDDCLEVYLDRDQDGFRFDANPEDAQAGLAPTGPDGRPQSWVWGALHQHVPEVQAAITLQEGGYRFEWAIPWSALGGRPAEGAPFGFTLTLHDRDANDHEAKLIWSVDKDTDPERLMFGEARLRP